MSGLGGDDELAAEARLHEELTDARGRIVDLLYIIDAFQIESGADRQAAYAKGIEAVRQLRRERDEALAAQTRIGERLTETVVRLAAYRLERDRMVAELEQLRSQVTHLTVERNALQQQLDVVLADREPS